MPKSNFHREPSTTPPKRSPATTLWTRQSLGDTWTGRLRDLGELGWEFELLRNDAHAFSRRFPTHADASHEADQQRQLIERDFRGK